MDSLFLPTTPEELRQRGWDALDVILITGDSYIDSPYIGAAVIGRILEQAGFRVGIIAQPAIDAPADVTRLGEPRLFWGVTGGSVDSMVANTTASKKRRKNDDYTPGGLNTRRPDRAVIVYTNLIRRYYKNTRPIVLGGIEASLRRVAHYDFWSDSLRRSILLDAKGDYLLYGMAEQSVLALARALQAGDPVTGLPGLCYLAKEAPADYLELPSFEVVVSDQLAFIDMFHLFYLNNDPLTARGLAQRHADRWLVQNPPAPYLDQAQLDEVYALPFQRVQHPYYEAQGAVKALETIQFSISTHRGCYGECNFCAIAVHEGRTVRWRSETSILAEAQALTHLPGFKGYLQDVGGPTANMYGFECRKKLTRGACDDRRCVYPNVCPALKPDHQAQTELLRHLRRLPGVKKVFVASGIRYDLVLADQAHGQPYLKEIVENHVSGQLKVAPEHSEPAILAKMGKPGREDLVRFKRLFDDFSIQAGKNQFLTYYLIAAYPGCTDADMYRLKAFASQELHISPEQVQIFTPTPSTYASLMYFTGLDPFSRQPLFVEKDQARRERQKAIVVDKPAGRDARSAQPRSKSTGLPR
ncbi:MAG TPA: YgiQ family radical SAM protein [Anaerolineaceae bacterium]